MRPRHTAALATEVEEDAYRMKVLEAFFRWARLIHIPAQRSKQQIILERLAQRFEPDRDYTEREVNLVLVEFHDDVEFHDNVVVLRRGLVGEGWMERTRGIYWRRVGAPVGWKVT
jgi:ArsR family transcriptional regulator, arsenate/arsenite/antimonite-responsive transcriptional repressor